MSKSLVIVESPAKAKTIEKFLGKGFTVKASMGHVRDLPASTLGVDLENNFEPKYVTLKTRQKIITDLKKSAKQADHIYLAPDPDREGEAIAWHLMQAISDADQDKIKRIEFNEITQKAVQNSLKNPREVDLDLVNAQQARRILDRIVGYKISPLLWKKIQKGLSAGRVQSVAVRLVCEREAEIDAFKEEEYWTIAARLATESNAEFTAQLKGRQTEPNGSVEKLHIGNKETASQIVFECEPLPFNITKVEKKERKRNPSAPFITSTLQQEASRKLGFSAKRTMTIAQQLYEGMDIGGELTGLITYMRTDSVRISDEALAEVRGYIQEQWGLDYLPPTVRFFKTKKSAQDAHEAVRPTSALRAPDTIQTYLDKDQFRLYELIWKRFVACQMTPALMDTTAIDILSGSYLFRANGSIMKFPGFMTLYVEGQDDKQRTEASSQEDTDDDNENLLPELTEGQKIDLRKIIPDQHFTEPPPRYTEATLVKTLEEKGIGRPSTYASIIGTIQDRQYVIKENKALAPTDMGKLVNQQLVLHFPTVLDIEFTADMEAKLDEIEEGKLLWQNVLKDFYEPFAESLTVATGAMQNFKPDAKPTDEICEKCGKPMVIRMGRFGEFIACTGFPECKTTKQIKKEPVSMGVKCPECGGEVIQRRSKKGRFFFGCSGYPNCKFAVWDKPTGELCPKCGVFMVKKAKKDKCAKCDYEKAEEE